MAGLFFSSGVDKGFDRDVKRMNAQMNVLSRNVSKQGSKINNTFKTITRSVGGLVSVMAIGAAGKELISFSKDLETALIEVATISQAVTEDFEGYKDALLAISTESATSARSLTDAFYDIVSAGYDGAAGLELLAASERASTAGFVEVGVAADGLTTVLNAWGKEASEAAAVSDIFFKTVEKGKTTFPELGQNIALVAPLAASMSVSFEEVSGAVATLTKSGTPTSQAFTQIRSAMIALDEQLGLGWASTMTLQEGMVELARRAEETGKPLKELTGRVEGALGVLGLTGKNALTAAEDLAAMKDSLNATATAADKVTTTTDQQIKILKNNILAALEPLGDAASKALGKLAKSLNEAFKSGNVEKYVKIILQLTKAFAVYKLSVLALNQVQKINNSLIALSHKANVKSVILGKRVTASNLLMAKSFKSISAAFKANPIGLLITGITLAIPLIERFRNKTKEATIDQDEFNRSLEETKELLLGFADIEKGQSILGLLTDEQLKEQKKKIEEQLKNEEDLNKSLLEEAKDRLEKDAELKRLNALISSNQVADVLKASYIRERNRRKQEITEDLQLSRTASFERIRELEKYFENVDKILKDRPDEVKKKDDKESEKARKKALAKLEIDNQEIINEITRNYGEREDLQREFNDRLLEQQLDYLDKKRKLTNDELEKSLIDQAIINARFDLNPPLQKLTSTYDSKQAPKLRKGRTTDPKELEDSTLDSITSIDQAFSQLGDSLVQNLAELSTTIIDTFETFSNESASSSEKISGIVSLILEAGNIINQAIKDTYANEAEGLDNINKSLASRISAESTLNRIIRDRAELELNQSAFLSADYKESYQLALDTLSDSENTINQTLEALGQNITLTAEGAGESWLGLNKVTEEYSFTLDQIVNGWNDLGNVQTRGVVTNILDPIDLFGAAADSDAMIDAYNKVSDGFNDALKSMGKTAADMAEFSSEEWTDFYTILDEGGYIVDQGSKQLVTSLREAQQEYTEALEQMKGIITDIAGSLGDALGDSIVNAVATGSDALGEFEKNLNKVFLEMAKAEMNQLFFQKMFDQLQSDMEESMAGGDQDWQDDLLRFYDQLPSAIEGAEGFLREFDSGLKELGFEGITDGEGKDANLSTAGQIRQSITEDTGTLLAGHIGAMRLSNERIANYSQDMLDLGVQNLVTLNKIKENTDYLPLIADNTKKTYQKLGGV